MKKLVILLLVVALGVGAWIWFGGLEDVTEERVKTVLMDNGLSENMADCMAPRMVERLSINQLRKLERAAPQDGESSIPLSTQEALDRIRRVDDREAIEVTVGTAGICVIETALDRR
ncbi:hypothetical protein [Altererythrobacter lutimaris]|uniref:Uncharacterized protein n=1 Tax=Altererythrobacter lutimaris TaxID=2743979 RepID=A0A850H5V3_9SPHN|nr:hypothetical protein [Altererythrobacter lutimaris]NVE94604.1 hypothetical protein [Altererythrobacter lutimaris]